MRVYVAVTGLVFALLVAAHVWRVLAESAALAREPDFIIVTGIAALLALWAARLLWAGSRSAAGIGRDADRVERS